MPCRHARLQIGCRCTAHTAALTPGNVPATVAVYYIEQNTTVHRNRKVQAALRYKRVPFTSHSLMPGDINQDWAERGFGEIKPKVLTALA